MLMCKGNGCNWKNACSRYVLGRGITKTSDISAEWMDHCLHHESKFIKCGTAEMECSK